MDKTYRDIRNHEAAHAVSAFHFGVSFIRVTQYKVYFPPEAKLSEHFKVILAAGCLGEFVEKREENKTPIEIAIEQFSETEYPEDFEYFTNGEAFNQIEFEECLALAWPIVEDRWKDIEKLSQMLQLRHEMSYENVVELLAT